MLQLHTDSHKILYRPCDILQETNMPSANDAERLISTCLYQAGSSGYLGPGAPVRIPE